MFAEKSKGNMGIEDQVHPRGAICQVLWICVNYLMLSVHLSQEDGGVQRR